MGPAATSQGKRKLLTEINMVPFIDVVLVLLIIFMVMSPFLAQSEIRIRLPQTTGSQAAAQDDPVSVQITKEGDFYINKGRVLRNDLRRLLAAALAKRPGGAVLIEADRDARFNSVVLALDAAEQLKAAKVGVAVLTEPPPAPEEEKKGP